MENSANQLASILNIVLAVMIGILVILIVVLAVIKIKEIAKKKKEEPEKTKKSQNKKIDEVYQKESVYDFMDFDTVEDNMIVRKKGTRFVMVIKCTGSNYDLASEDEKLAIESGFIKFLNSLKFPIQIYIQTRKFNIDNSIREYKEKLNKLSLQAEKARTEYEVVRRTPNISENKIKEAYMELRRTSNIYEYAKDVVANTERIRTNRNIMKKEHYIAISYSPLEEVNSVEMLDKEEIKDKAFSELYIRCQSLIRVLNACDVNGKILNSTELAELLYVAYNREQYEVYGIDKVLNSNYNQLYVTSEDILDKKMNRLNEKVRIEATRQANELVNKVKSEKEKELKEREDNIDKMIKQMTEMILEQNKNNIGEDILQRAKQALEKETAKEKEGKNEGEKTKGTRSKRESRKNA